MEQPRQARRSRTTRLTILTLLNLHLLLSLYLGAQTKKDRIDFYFGDWHTSPSRRTHGALEERDILTRGDAMNPTKEGAVLRFLNSYTYATLPAHAATEAEQLQGQQQIYFVESGEGKVRGGAQSIALHKNVAVLIPSGFTFQVENSGEQPLTMYVIDEPATQGFRPNPSMLARDENQLPITSSSGMWAHIVKTLFVAEDGLSSLQAVLTVTLDPLTVGKPHPVPGEDTDEIEKVWTALDGKSLALVGNQLRWQTPGMAYLHIPDNQNPHTNINGSQDSQSRFLYFARYRSHELRK